MNDYDDDILREDHKADARYMTWLLLLARERDAELWFGEVDGEIVYAVRREEVVCDG